MQCNCHTRRIVGPRETNHGSKTTGGVGEEHGSRRKKHSKIVGSSHPEKIQAWVAYRERLLGRRSFNETNACSGGEPCKTCQGGEQRGGESQQEASPPKTNFNRGGTNKLRKKFGGGESKKT